ncbi:ParA family protein [Erysipelothrix aquatica]|uniref:ParA family protein n=1 Tax=Erysipelothrix aquatica TaxID=2683714 RepID=UPI00135C5C5E|nr:ParA family protein [Erysipelothrix aquatica]
MTTYDIKNKPKRKVIAVANQKGGVGKTTTSINLSAGLAYLGYKVLLKDADTTGSATLWVDNIYSSLKEDELVPFDFEIANKTSLSRNREKYDFVIIDTPPQETMIMDAAIKVADYVVIPTAPTSLDIDRVIEILRLIENKPCKVLLTQIKVNTITYRAAREMFEDQDIQFFNTGIAHREAVIHSIGQLPSEDAMRDYHKIVSELLVDLDCEVRT